MCSNSASDPCHYHHIVAAAVETAVVVEPFVQVVMVECPVVHDDVP